jgi:hypothetical protein
MNGNNPYAGTHDAVEAGKRTQADAPSLSPDTRRAIRADVARIASRTREFLPGEFAVGSEISAGVDGPQVTVAVEPPVGNPVSAGFQPDVDGDDPIPSEDREEVARGLAASAALQVKQTVGDDFEPTAK